METSNDQENDENKKKSSVFSSIVIFVGVFGVGLLIVAAWNGIIDFVKSIPWYISIPIIGAIIFLFYKIGKGKNWW